MDRPERRTRRVVGTIGAFALVVGIALLVRAADTAALTRTWRAATDAPARVAAVLLLYALAFVLRALVWTRTVPHLSPGHALAAVHVSLGANHVLPFRLGEALRVTSVVRRARLPLAAATASTVMLRGADILAVVGLAALAGPGIATSLIGGWAWALLPPAAALWAGGLWWLRRLDRSRGLRVGRAVLLVAAAAAAAWLLESAVMWQTARWAGIDIGVPEAVLVTSVTIAAQVLAVAPAGVGTYEAAATAALVALGAPAGAALAAAITAHALKTAYGLATGAVALLVPAPSALGRFRLPPPGDPPPARGPDPRVRPEDPVVLFLPAHNEEATVGEIVRRAPCRVLGRPVRVLVLDDGSDDATAAVARAAGAGVHSFTRHRGLGAAVRTGLALAAAQGCAAAAFCDADGEYAPEELERLVAPILAGEADYVVGSRFAGAARRMPAHRLLGNALLTRLLRVVARRPISDGQSGYRAFSRRAAGEAEVIHDYNYAQVLTLDLLAKGYRYSEVPISYGFRRSGESFVRLSSYVRRVVPAVYRELNGV